jgi:hypothetical protein
MKKIKYVPEDRGPWVRPIRISKSQFTMIWEGKQNFTLQEHTQQFEEGNVAQLMETDGGMKLTGRQKFFKMGTVVCAGPTTGIIPGWCVISLLPLDRNPKPKPTPKKKGAEK